MDMTHTSIINDEALNDISGGGIKSAIAMGGTYAVLSGSSCGIAAGPVGAVVGGVLGGAMGFIGGMFMSDSAVEKPRTSRRGLIR